jgi:hypothetical protein
VEEALAKVFVSAGMWKTFSSCVWNEQSSLCELRKAINPVSVARTYLLWARHPNVEVDEMLKRADDVADTCCQGSKTPKISFQHKLDFRLVSFFVHNSN